MSKEIGGNLSFILFVAIVALILVIGLVRGVGRRIESENNRTKVELAKLHNDSLRLVLELKKQK